MKRPKMSDKEFLEAVRRDDEEHDEMARKYPERVLHYMRLGFFYSQINRELVEDDVRWEQARKIPVDPNNGIDQFVKKKGWVYSPGILVK